MPDPYVAALGRISGALLNDNLQRNGVDLTFRNGSADPDLLYLDVTNMRVGVNTDSPVYDLDVNNDVRTTDLIIGSQADIDNIRIQSTRTFTTSVGGINLVPSGHDPVIYHDRMTTASLIFDGNTIDSISNQNIILDPNGSGSIQLFANTSITGNLAVSGNITMGGNLSSAGTIIVGDQPIDTVTIVPDFTQSIIPGADITYDMGYDTLDSSPRRWAQIHAPDWTKIENIRPDSVTISNQMTLNGISNTIFATQSNDDLRLNPDTGITYIERTKWQGNELTNLNNTPLTLASTGIGYTRFMDTNAMVIPSGTTSERRGSPELGETRWNTTLGYLECWDGTQWAVSTGGGEEVTVNIMDDYSNIWGLILG